MTGRSSRSGHDRWLVSYADFITLLFAFFVVLYAVSQSDKAKARDLSEAVRRALAHAPANARPAGGSDTASPPGPEALYRSLIARLSREVESGSMQVKLDNRGVIISLHDKAFFQSGMDGIVPEASDSLLKVADALRETPNAVSLEGHTDSLPIHNSRFASNWQLSAARSIAVLSFFESRCGIPASRFAVAGYADNQPVAENDSEAGRAKNRRVDIVILTKPAPR